jgi:hemerythrin-like metal-binding protein
MAFLEWRLTYSVGVEELDQQHRQLILLINQLHKTVSDGDRLSTVMAAIDALVESARYHFGEEERMMERAGYAGLEPHRQKHQEMLAKLTEFRTNVDLGVTRISIPVMSFLSDWLSVHIMKVDRPYMPYLTGGLKVWQGGRRDSFNTRPV